MPDGINVEVTTDGDAVIEFVDPALRGPVLGALNKIGAAVSVDTRSGRRFLYRVPEEAAAQAGLIDTAPPAKSGRKKASPTKPNG
ncbi:hypothetical protein VST63_11195 [Mycolicibacterium sp. 050232]|uniref:hypothetical protein n=1 Tax=Mycolicibacterium sp. 050232 TaxID=3113982 RepID=UPI002E2ADA60|nr:hypothetical protein [Mycolicibacterium sp. 050232]MED5812926.1 hypothetical protein [Mycolicibacterium sp. 050232]